MYVVDIRPDSREIVIGTDDDLFGHAVTLSDVNWLAEPVDAGASTWIQCRYRAAAVPAIVSARNAEAVQLRLTRPVRAITPGQSGVLYDETGRVLGGGLIA